MTIQDLHAHTYYSFDCKDSPKRVIETAIASGVNLLGISDHNHGVGLGRKALCYNQGTNLSTDYEQTLLRYFDHIDLLKEKYRNKIKILRGIEVATCVGKDNYACPKPPIFPFSITVLSRVWIKRTLSRKGIFFHLPSVAVARRVSRIPIYLRLFNLSAKTPTVISVN